MSDHVPFARYVRRRIQQLCILVVVECLAFTVLFAFSASSPMYVIELDRIRVVHGSFGTLIALAAVTGLVGMLVLTKNLLEFMATSDEFVELERLATLGKFSAWTAHQIRNPLAIIRGQAQLLSLKPQPELVQKGSALIIRQSDKMSDLMSLMMTLSQPVILNKEQIDVPAMCSDITESYAAAYPKIVFTQKGSIEGLVLGHPGLLEEALKNVFTNAMESMDGVGPIEVECSESAGTATIRITDSGPGISDEALASAFEIGFTTKKYGTGLGLPIVKTIMNAHGGSVTIERAKRSQAEHGTIVTLTLPKAEL
jgi:two-component system NtrC family sensor kinase